MNLPYVVLVAANIVCFVAAPGVWLFTALAHVGMVIGHTDVVRKILMVAMIIALFTRFEQLILGLLMYWVNVMLLTWAKFGRKPVS